MELNDLIIFQKVAEHGSVSKAAQQLNYVQSNVTARIKMLENELQTPLFNRHQRGMLLNSEGKRLLEYTRDIIAKVEEMKQSFQDQQNPAGILKVGIVETVIALPHILSSFNDHYPNVELSLMAGVTDQLVQEVAQMELDGAFVTGPIRHPQIEQINVIREKLVLVAKKDSFTLDQLPITPLLLYHKGCGYRGKLEQWMKNDGIIAKKIMEFGTFGTIIGSVSAGIGVTVIPESSVTDLIEKEIVEAHPFPDPYSDITTIFVWRKDSYLTSTLASFIEEIKAHSKIY